MSTKPSIDDYPLSRPVEAKFSSRDICFGGGVAIFHIASARVALCYHTKRHKYFLPKGRRDIGEDSSQLAAEREGYEESGYRSRILPLPIKHCQPLPVIPTGSSARSYVTEPIVTQFRQMTATCQYVVFWYVAETLPPTVEEDLDKKEREMGSSGGLVPYLSPPRFPEDMTLQQRVAQEPAGYEPIKHDTVKANEDEEYYESSLVPVEEALKKLSTIHAEIVARGWNAIQMRTLLDAKDPTS